MTLVLTELSNAGIAMATDSAITKLSQGKVIEVDQQGWSKLLPVSSITAAISYWGTIGAVTKMQFDIWLKRVIDSERYTDLESFADHLANALNDACHGKPLAEGQDVGIHVAGYSQWSDGHRRPVFFHVHNGHGLYDPQREWDEEGRLIAVRPKWVSEPRKLFEKHQDFPKMGKTLEENLAILQNGYITHNGAYFLYSVIWKHMRRAFQYINLIPGVSIPRNPSELRSRKGFLHTMLDTMVRLYRCSNQSLIIGGDVTSLGIGPEGYLP